MRDWELEGRREWKERKTVGSNRQGKRRWGIGEIKSNTERGREERKMEIDEDLNMQQER